MNLLTLHADMSGIASALDRIAAALERISLILFPPLPDSQTTGPANTSENHFYMSESPEEHEARTTRENELAISLGVAPWSPAFQTALNEMRSEIMKPRQVINEEGEQPTASTEQYTHEEADDIIRKAFQQAKAQANARRETKDKPQG